MYLTLITKIRGKETEWDYAIKLNDNNSSPSEIFHIMLVIYANIPNCFLKT